VKVSTKHVFLLLLAAWTLVGCTAGAPTASSAPTKPTPLEAITLAPAAQRYGAIVGPVATVISTFEKQSGALPADATVDDFVALARPFVATIATVDDHLRQVSWPLAARPDIRTELVADQSLRSDLTGSTLDVSLLLSVWRHEIISAATKASRAQRNVSVDLGLLSPA
jgi:hypothetical protein